VVLCGVVWCGVVSRGAVWCDVEWLLCCAVLCCAVLCCAVLYCVVCESAYNDCWCRECIQVSGWCDGEYDYVECSCYCVHSMYMEC
jgi:hypothetical protein